MKNYLKTAQILNTLNNRIIGLVLLILVAFTSTFVGQSASTPQNRDTTNKADQNLRSAARVNPSTLAMEFSLPLASYPGRNGNNFPVGLSYSSKVWRMKDQLTITSGTSNIITHARPTFAERSSDGWTSTFTPPIIEEDIKRYDQTGRPYTSELDDYAANLMFNDLLANYQSIGNNLLSATCGWYCEQTRSEHQPDGTVIRTCTAYSYGCIPNYPGGGNPPPEQPSTPLYYIDRLRIRTSDGATHELRKDDVVHACGDANAPCTPVREGIYLSVDGSGLRLEKGSTGSILYMPDGSRFTFPGTYQQIDGEGAKLYFADTHLDADGNRSTYTKIVNENGLFIRKTDTLGRQLTDFLPQNLGSTITRSEFEQNVTLPGLPNLPQNYKLTWKQLKPVGCEDQQDNPTCGNGDGALENQSEKLFFEARYGCFSNAASPPIADSSEVLFTGSSSGIKICSGLFVINNGNIVYQRFNPQVLASIRLPNNKEYSFKYNQWGEISKIVHPTGKIERFEYGYVPPLAATTRTAYDQANRGVTKHWIYSSPNELSAYHEYNVAATSYPTNSFKITHRINKGSSPSELGMRTERDLVRGDSFGLHFGFENPLVGMPYEEKTFDENNVLRSRTLTEYITKDNGSVKRDARVKRTVSVAIENGQALAILSETEYNEAGTTGNNAQTDADYFSHLDVKRAKGYHYAVIDVNTAQTGTLAQIAGYFNSSLLASVSETDYEYNPNYKDRGIRSLPIESRVLNPSNNEIVAKTRTIYDNAVPAASTNYPYSTETYGISGTFSCPSGTQSVTCWQSPGSSALGRPTTSRLWDDDNDIWIESHTRYDIFGNAVKVKNAAGNEAETIFENTTQNPYHYAYPVKVITPAPDPTNTHGTNQGSFATTTYDFMTGLPLTATNEFGQTTATEYNDDLLRPTRSFAVNFTAPETQTIYDDTNLTVKVRKQIDATNWDEAISYSDSLGRTFKTQAKDSQGDVFTETEYDFLGRVKRATNPYRSGETKLWSKPRYDVMGRAVESFAPAIDGQTGASSGITEYGISTMPGYIGTFVMTTDAAGKKSRAITNGLGQLIRVDEPDHTGGLTALPQGTPNPSPTPTPNEPPELPPPGCTVECLTNTEYPSYATVYRYNEQGKMVEVIQGEQHRYFKYDSLGRLIRVKQPEQEVNTPALDLADNYNTSGKWTAKFTYDLMGNVISATDANGTTITNAYDKANRVITKSYSNEPNGQTTPSVSYFYDGKGLDQPQTPNYAKGKLTKVTSSVSETRYTSFDNLGRLLQSQQITDGQTYTSIYQYNLSGALVQETYPSGRVVKNEFKSDGNLSRVFGQANLNSFERTYANGFSYTASGAIERFKLGNGKWQSANFNSRLQVTQLALGNSSTDVSLWKVNYEYGELNSNGTVDVTKNIGNIAKQTVTVLATSFIQSYKYDSLERIIEAKETTNGNQNWLQQIGYDRYGNRISFNQLIGQTQKNQTPTVNANTNRFATGQGFVYDSNGNLTSDAEGRQFAFNGENKQILVKDVNNQVVGQYFYDGNGKRVKKVTNTETTIFVYNSAEKLVAEYSTQTNQNPTMNYTISDHLGSPRVITNQLGEVVSRRDFMPFGEELYVDGTNRTTNLKYGASDSIRQKFTGYQKDEETNLDFAEARYYDSQYGRFTAIDPLLSSANLTIPQSFNRFVYCRNNPFKYIDRSGEYPTEIHNDIVKRAFPGLSDTQQKMIMYGSALVDTSLGTGSWIQFGGNGSNPNMESLISIGVIFDFPKTLLPSEAYKHAMIPEGMSEEQAYNKAYDYIVTEVNTALGQQNQLDPTGQTLSLDALTSFGKAAHTIMDSTSPTHRYFQPYGIPTKVEFDEFGVNIGTSYDWGAFVMDSWKHKDGESGGNVTEADKISAIRRLQLNFLTSFGKTAFEIAVTDQNERDAIYQIVNNSNGVYFYPNGGGVAGSWSATRNILPRNQNEIYNLAAPPCQPGQRC